MNNNDIGSVTWFDLSVKNAEQVSEFYHRVVGWKINPISMGEYDDYSMQEPKSGKDVAGVCHARGVNAALPPQWLMYIKVADLTASLAEALALGAEQVTEIKNLSSTSQYAVIKDPAGAVCALYDEQ